MVSEKYIIFTFSYRKDKVTKFDHGVPVPEIKYKEEQEEKLICLFFRSTCLWTTSIWALDGLLSALFSEQTIEPKDYGLPAVSQAP